MEETGNNEVPEGYVPPVVVDILQSKNEKGLPNGYAPLDATGKVPTDNLPPIGGTWATITGNLEDNNDLWNALGSKLDTNAFQWSFDIEAQNAVGNLLTSSLEIGWNYVPNGAIQPYLLERSVRDSHLDQTVLDLIYSQQLQLGSVTTNHLALDVMQEFSNLSQRIDAVPVYTDQQVRDIMQPALQSFSGTLTFGYDGTTFSIDLSPGVVGRSYLDATLNAELDGMVNTINQLDTSLTSLFNTVDSNTTESQGLSSDVSNLNTAMADVQLTTANNTNEIAGLQATVNDHTLTITNSYNDIQNLQMQINDLQASLLQITDLQQQIAQLQQEVAILQSQ